MEYLLVGQIVKTVGLKGEVKIYPSTHFRDSRFKSGNHLFLLDENGEKLQELTVKSHRKNGPCDNVVFQEISSIDEAELYVKKNLFVIKDQNFLKHGEFFYTDLEQMEVYFDNGQKIGKVKKVEEYNSYATLRVETEGKDVLIPYVKSFIVSTSLQDMKIIVHYIEGLVWKSIS